MIIKPLARINLTIYRITLIPRSHLPCPATGFWLRFQHVSVCSCQIPQCCEWFSPDWLLPTDNQPCSQQQTTEVKRAASPTRGVYPPLMPMTQTPPPFPPSPLPFPSLPLSLPQYPFSLSFLPFLLLSLSPAAKCPLKSARGLEERFSSPSGVRGEAPAANAFWVNLVPQEMHLVAATYNTIINMTHISGGILPPLEGGILPPWAKLDASCVQFPLCRRPPGLYVGKTSRDVPRGSLLREHKLTTCPTLDDVCAANLTMNNNSRQTLTHRTQQTYFMYTVIHHKMVRLLFLLLPRHLWIDFNNFHFCIYTVEELWKKPD